MTTEFDGLSASQLKEAFLNVQEQWILFDTSAVFNPPDNSGLVNPEGWFLSLNQLGSANEVSFFNVRNRTAGKMWNNQDKRSELSFPFQIQSLGITFWSQVMTSSPSIDNTSEYSPEDHSAHIFMTDIPRHCGVTLRLQQDDRLKTHPFFCSPGYGPVGDGYGRGSPSKWGSIVTNGNDHFLSTNSAGVPIMNNRWLFPLELEVPRTASMSVTLNFNEYARQMLQIMPFLSTWWGNDATNDADIVKINAMCGIQVSLIGKRLVQQRGKYHR